MKTMMRNLLELQTLEFAGRVDARTAVVIAERRRQIPAQILDHYDRMRTRGKRALAAVNHQVCGGCHMQVPLGVVMTLKHGHDLQLCENCGRYLYLPEVENTAAAIPETVTKPAPRKRRRKPPVAPD